MPAEESPSAVIGRGVRVRGEVTGTAPVVVEGEVEGTIQLEHGLTVAPGGVVRAEVHAARITVRGRTNGRLEATERVEIAATGVVEGELVAPQVVLAEGALFNGTIQMDVALPDGV